MKKRTREHDHATQAFRWAVVLHASVNIVPVNENCTVPNVRTNYTVTDKADGARKLLYICPSGRIYFIDTNMRFQFTGAQSDNKKLFYTLLDGEHILHDKNGRFINPFAAFDVYYIAGKDAR